MRSRPARVLLPLLAVAGVALAGLACQREPALPRPRHVFLITVDTLRADHTSLYGYPRNTTPSVAAMAPQAVLFASTIAQWPKTGASFASMFTGRYPQTTGMMQKAALRIPPQYHTLPEMLHDAGYRTAAVVSNAVLGKKLGWNRGFDEYLETWGGGDFPTEAQDFRHLVHAPRVNELALPLLDRHAKDDRLFVWIHYTDPHAPYLLPPGTPNPFLNDARYTGGDKVPDHLIKQYRLGDQNELRYYVAQYDANVAVADHHIGLLLDHMRKLGLLDDALVIFTGDHGESLGDHGSYFEHGRQPYDNTSHVPLLVWGSGIAHGRRVDRPVELVDLYPTLREIAAPDAKVHGLEGRSLVPWLRPAAPHPTETAEFRYAFSEAGERPHYYRSVQDGSWHLVQGFGAHRHGDVVPGGWELYDLRKDPGEVQNLAMSDTGDLRRLRSALLRWAHPGAERRQLTPQSGDADAEKALHALGYAQ